MDTDTIDTDKVLAQYLYTAVWAECDPDTEEPLDKTYSTSDITQAGRKQAREDVEEFVNEIRELDGIEALEESDIGHDFWLTRNGHGAGFWDGDVPEPLATQLTEIAKSKGRSYVWPCGNNRHINIETM